MDKLRTLTDLSGSVLDLASGPFSLGYLFRDAGAVQHFLIAFTFRRLLDDGSTTALSVS